MAKVTVQAQYTTWDGRGQGVERVKFFDGATLEGAEAKRDAWMEGDSDLDYQPPAPKVVHDLEADFTQYTASGKAGRVIRTFRGKTPEEAVEKLNKYLDTHDVVLNGTRASQKLV